jgi:hypothetical protein
VLLRYTRLPTYRALVLHELDFKVIADIRLALDPLRRQELGGAGCGHAELQLGTDRILSRFEQVLLGIV